MKSNMLVPNLKPYISQPIRILSYTFSHHVLCILVPIANGGFHFQDIMSGRGVCLISTSVNATRTNGLLRTVYKRLLTLYYGMC